MRIVLALMLAIASGNAEKAGAEEAWPTFGSPFKFTERTGEAVYQSVCAGCHMPDGRGATGAGTYPSLIGDPRLGAVMYPIGLVLKGQKAMPPFGDSLTNDQVAAVVSYIRTHFGNDFTGPTTAAYVATGR